MTYRTKCETCRFWSELIAEVRAGQVQAVCLADGGVYQGQYTGPGTRCDEWKASVFGSIDDPGIKGSPITDEEYDRRVRAL